jgi:hypothetical protein
MIPDIFLALRFIANSAATSIFSQIEGSQSVYKFYANSLEVKLSKTFYLAWLVDT